jgi:hypothetical protein
MAKKDEKRKKDKPAADPGTIRVAAHPRARASIRRWRGRAGLAGLVIVTLLSLRAGVPAFDAVIRGLAGGVAAQFVAWTAAVVLWRHLVIGELTAHHAAREAAAAERRAAAEARAAQAMAARN